jgi:adenylate kinase
MSPILLIVGPPNGGKGTLCDSIVRDFGLVHLSGGDILREHIKQRTPLGLEARQFMDRGELVPDATMIKLFLSKLESPEVQKRGALLDGFPRTKAQGIALSQSGIRVDALIVLEVPDEVLLERSAGRRLDPSTGKIYHLKHKPPPAGILKQLVIRPDDTAERQTMRIALYKKSLGDLLSHFADVAIKVDANAPMNEVYDSFVKKATEKGVLPKKSKL